MVRTKYFYRALIFSGEFRVLNETGFTLTAYSVSLCVIEDISENTDYGIEQRIDVLFLIRKFPFIFIVGILCLKIREIFLTRLTLDQPYYYVV